MADKQLDVFISYARGDASNFVDELTLGLEVGGFRPLIDRQSISAAEDWKARIGVLIQQCDTVIVVITPSAVKSDILKWELKEAVRLSKRIVPIEWLPTPIEEIPPELAKLNFIFFSAGTSFARSLKSLTEALETDIEWLREHTRLAERALDWANQFNRDDNALLLGKQIAVAEDWLARRPPSAPNPTPLHLEFISASRRVAIEQEGAERKRLAEIAEVQIARAEALDRLARRTVHALIGLALLAVVICVIASVVYVQKREIESATLRLRAGLALNIARTDRVVHATDAWYRVATDYKLSIGIIRKQTARTGLDQFGTGFLVRGNLLNPNWGETLVFVTAGHVIGSPSSRQAADADVVNYSATFPALEDQSRVDFSGLAFISNELDVAVLNLSGKPPANAIPIENVMPALPKNQLDGVAVLNWTAKDGFSLGFGHGIAVPPPSDDSSFLLKGPELYYYTHMTGPGASGSPVFDANTGKLACLHIAGNPRMPRPWGVCRAIAAIIDAIAAETRSGK